MTEREESAELGSPVGVRKVRAAFAIRWDPAGDGDGAVMTQVTGRLGAAVLRGEVWAASIRPSLREDGWLVLPEVLDSIDGFALREDLVAVDEPDPLCLVAVKVEADEPIGDVITAGTDENLPTVSWSRLLRLTDELLYLATLGLGDIAPERAFGPLSYGDLVGAGVLRLGDPDEDPFDLPILPRPQLGCWQPGPASAGQDEVRTVFGDLLSSRRLMWWVSRFALRQARGEWPEAVVAFEASVEAGIWAVLECLLIDHGWESTDLTGQEMPGNVKSAISALQAHLGGNWTPVRDDFAALWELRNRALHRSEQVTESDVHEVVTRGASLTRIIAERLAHPEVARKHPVTTYLFNSHSQDALSSKVQDAVAATVEAVKAEDVRLLNDKKHPGDRRTTTANECPSRADSVWVA